MLRQTDITVASSDDSYLSIKSTHFLLLSTLLTLFFWNTYYRCRVWRISFTIYHTNSKLASKGMKTGKGKTGRPIGFDKDSALEAAMLLFWERGFEGTSMADLTEAMNLNPSSIYAAFGDKHALFSLTVKRYLESRAQYATEALEEPTLERVIRALFDNTVAFLTAPGHPPTCMTLAGAMGCSVDAAPARDLMTEVRRQNEAAIRERLLVARKAGELSKEINVDDYTRYLSLLLAGLSIQAANGSTKAELKRTAHLALRHLGY